MFGLLDHFFSLLPFPRFSPKILATLLHALVDNLSQIKFISCLQSTPIDGISVVQYWSFIRSSQGFCNINKSRGGKLRSVEKMSVIDILTRVDAICNKYDKYDVEKQRESQISGSDAFIRLFTIVESDIEAAMHKANDAEKEKNRAVVATLNAEIRRTKGRLHEEIPKLQKLAQKKVKGVSKEELVVRNDLVFALEDKINSIPDGTTTGTQRVGGLKPSSARTRTEIKMDSGGMHTEYFQQTEESSQFRQEYEMRKARQDQGLDMIAEGLDTLKNMAQDINEELDRQVPLIDEIDTKVEKATSDLKNTNVRLKETVTKMRSSRNFCIDIILLCIILGIAAYLYNVLKK